MSRHILTLLLPVLLLTGCMGTPAATDPAALVPQDIKVALFPDTAMMASICQQLNIDPTLVDADGAVMFYDAGSVYWLTAAIPDTQVLEAYLDSLATDSDNEASMNLYQIGQQSTVIVRAGQMWACSTPRAKISTLLSIIERGENSSLRAVDIVDIMQSQTTADSVFVCSGALASKLMMPADAWVCGRCIAPAGNEVRGWLKAFSETGTPYPMLQMFSKVQLPAFQYIPDDATRIIAFGCENVDWQALADYLQHIVPFKYRLMLPSLVKILGPVSGTVAIAKLPNDQTVIVAEMDQGNAWAVKADIDRFMSSLNVEHIHITPTANALVISTYPYEPPMLHTNLGIHFDGARAGIFGLDANGDVLSVMLRDDKLVVDIPNIDLL